MTYRYPRQTDDSSLRFFVHSTATWCRVGPRRAPSEHQGRVPAWGRVSTVERRWDLGEVHGGRRGRGRGGGQLGAVISVTAA